MIALERLSSRAGGFTLKDVTITLPKGAWGIVLGPAGSGKTTLLETIAGVRRATSGRVMLRDADVTTLSPDARRVGMVYQHGYLFPHLTVEENIAYGAGIESAREMAGRFGADAFASRSVTSLSGGERQIVALARALAPSPDILLLDEPFAALDPRRRVRARVELRRIQRERGMTVLHVTHDFVEAGTLGDLAMVLDGGRLSQSGTPDTIFRKPASGAVADFLGAENVYSGRIRRRDGDGDIATLDFSGDSLTLIGVGDHPGGTGHAVIRAEDVVLARLYPNPGSARNVLEGRIVEVAPNGVLSRVTIAVGTSSLVAIVTRDSVTALGLAVGESVVASIKATAVHLC
ncbi:MAG: ABC transporter ATP-binding protein [bacterium]